MNLLESGESILSSFSFTHLDHSYVHGIMDGESLAELEDFGRMLHPEEFWIR